MERLKTEYDIHKIDQAAKGIRMSKENAFRQLLREVGVSDCRLDAVMKVSDIDKLELDNDGIKDIETIKNNIKSELADFIVGVSTGGTNTQNSSNTQGGVILGIGYSAVDC